jgi:hypothetical protein
MELLTTELREQIRNGKHPRLTGNISSGLWGNISSGLTGDISSLWGNISSGLTGNISDLTGNISGLTGNISSGLTGNISSDLTGDISDLTGDISDLTGNISGLTGNISDLTGNIGGLRKDIAAGKYPGVSIRKADADEIARLDAVREIVLNKPERLVMDCWHSDEWTADHTPEEEHSCGSAHCIAGWLQALSPDEDVRRMNPMLAGHQLAPASAYMFYSGDDEALHWLKDREYAR